MIKTSTVWILAAVCCAGCNTSDDPEGKTSQNADSADETEAATTDDSNDGSSEGSDGDATTDERDADSRDETEASDGDPSDGAPTDENGSGDPANQDANDDGTGEGAPGGSQAEGGGSQDASSDGITNAGDSGSDSTVTEDPPDGDASGIPSTAPADTVDNPLTAPTTGPPAGNPEGNCDIPLDALPEDVSDPDHVIGDGAPESCTAEAVVETIALGGVITFNCGPDPVTITLDEPARIYNDSTEEIVIDGGGLVTLSGGGSTRILYMNTCDESLTWTTPTCDNQDHPRLSIQNLTFIDGDSRSETEYDGGGAIYASGGRVKIINSRFFNNRCADEGPDVGGAGVRVFQQYEDQPVYLVNSTFGGEDGYGNVCSNGGGISSIGVSWTIINSLFSHNQAVGNGGNPAEEGTPGGGSGGAIYNDGLTMTLSLCGTRIEDNSVNAYGSGIFFVSNNHDGTLEIRDSIVRGNTGGGWNVLPGISMHDDTEQIIESSVIE